MLFIKTNCNLFSFTLVQKCPEGLINSLNLKTVKISDDPLQKEIRRNYDDAYACVELLLSSGADIYPEIIQSAGQSEVADIIHHYDITAKSEIYNFIKRSMGKCSLNVHNQLVAAVRFISFSFQIHRFFIRCCFLVF